MESRVRKWHQFNSASCIPAIILQNDKLQPDLHILPTRRDVKTIHAIMHYAIVINATIFYEKFWSHSSDLYPHFL